MLHAFCLGLSVSEVLIWFFTWDFSAHQVFLFKYFGKLVFGIFSLSIFFLVSEYDIFPVLTFFFGHIYNFCIGFLCFVEAYLFLLHLYGACGSSMKDAINIYITIMIICIWISHLVSLSIGNHIIYLINTYIFLQFFTIETLCFWLCHRLDFFWLPENDFYLFCVCMRMCVDAVIGLACLLLKDQHTFLFISVWSDKL